MKILELELLAYGPFTDTSLDLSGGDCGLHIVYGPNEAGKSSTLRAIHGLLYGIQTKTTDNFLHDNKKLRIGGRLSNAAGDELHFHRRKGNKDTLLNPKAAKGGAYADEVLAPFIQGVDQDSFARVYGIGNDQLEEGGREMAALQGLVGESLFAATVGGPGLAELLGKLDENAAAIFDSRKRSATLKTLGTRYKELTGERRSVQLAKTRWENLQSELRKARERRDEVVSREKDLSKQLRRLKRIQNGLSLIARRRETLKRVDELSGATVLPDGYSVEDRNRAEADLAGVRKRIERLKEQLEGERSFTQQIASIAIPDGLLGFEDAINELKDRRAVTVSAQADTVKLQRKIETLTTQAKELLRDLGFESSIEEAEQYRLRSEDQVLIRNLATDAKRLREQPRLLQKEREELETQLEQVQSDLKELGYIVEVGDLRKVLEETNRAGDFDAELEQLQQEHDAATRKAEGQLATLGLCDGPMKKVVSLSVPLNETVHRFREEFAQHELAAELLQNESVKLRDQLGLVRQEIAALQTAGSVPTEAELNQLRGNRDDAWQQIRDDWLRNAFTKAMPIEKAEQLASAFSRSVSEADQLGDRLRRETERVAQLAAQTARQTRIEEQIEQTESTAQKESKETAALQKEWKKQWKAAGVSDPLSPTEMLGWLERLVELRETVAESEDLKHRLEQTQENQKVAANALRSELKSVGEKALVKTPLAALVVQAETLVDAVNDRADQSERLMANAAQLKTAIEKVTRDEKRAADDLAKWQAQWAPQMKQLGCGEDAIAEQANERISALNRLFELVRQIREEEQRVQDIESDAEQFNREAEQLASRFLGQSGLDATDAAIQLHTTLQTARAEQARLESIQEAQHNANVELIDLEGTEAVLVKELEALCSLAGVTDVASLPEKERTSTELAELIRRRHELEDQLHEQTAGQPLEEFIEDADSEDADELPEQIDAIERELANLEGERDAAVVAVNDLEKQAAEADGNDKAANLDQEALGVLSTMHDEAQRYMQLRLASTMLRKQIEVHRAENEDPLLQRASDLFARMTCGEFSGLRTDYENDQPVIVGVRGNDDMVPVSGMSDGTRNQLYLALRLGYVEHQLMKYEPMPFIVDDILIHFDDTRSKATLQVLSELAEQTQVIFLTHHRHLLDLANENLPANQLFVHHLDSRGRELSPVSSPARPR